MAEFPKTAIIIVNWNGKKLLKTCLESIQKLSYPNFITIVVDNNSKDESVSFIKNNFPDTLIVETGSNIGYGAGCNLGALKAIEEKCEYLYFSNNDILFKNDFLEPMIKVAATETKLGLLGASVYHMNKPQKIQSLGLNINKINQIVNIDKFYHDQTVLKVDSIMGGAFLMPTVVFQKTGGFDPQYFMYAEEVDLSIRVKKMGYKIQTCLTAKVFHEVYGSFEGEENILSTYYIARNQLLLLKKNFSKNDYVKFVLAGCFYSIPRKIAVLIKNGNKHLVLPYLYGWINGLTCLAFAQK